MSTDRATRARVSAAEHALDVEQRRLTQDVRRYPAVVGPVVVDDYFQAAGARKALERKLQSLGPGPAEDPESHRLTGSEHLQPPGTVDETGFSSGGIV